MANIQQASHVAQERYKGYTDELLAEEIQYLEAYLATLKELDVADRPLHTSATAQLLGARSEQKRRKST